MYKLWISNITQSANQPIPIQSSMKHEDVSAPTPDTLLQTPEVNEERQQQILELLAPLLSELTAELTPEKCATIQDPAACKWSLKFHLFISRLVIESLLDSPDMMSRVQQILDRHNREVAERDEEDA